MKKIFVTLVLFTLTACAVGPDYQEPDSDFSNEWTAAQSAAQEEVTLDWWKIFNDPMLENYIQVAAGNNKDVQVAIANLRRARALRQEQGGALFPQISGGTAATRAKSSDDLGGSDVETLYDAGFDASWELDIFGGNRRAVEAADARVGSAQEDFHAVMLATLSEVARSYYEARGLQKRIAITEENSKLLEQTYNLVDARSQAGEASEFDLSRARGEYQLTRARIPNLQAELQATIFNLSVLTGQPPETLLEQMQQVKPLPTPPDMVPVGLRSDILRRRPDVRFAERELAASVADVGAETAELFPKLFLTGDIGSQARVFGDLFSSGVWSLGSLIQWSLFEGGAIRARIEAQDAESQAALATYEKTVLQALADAESALSRYGQELETRRRLEEGVQSRRKSVALARELFNAGEEDYLAVLDSERELTAGEDSLVLSETQSVIKLIALYTALGGGWEAFEMKP